MMKTIKLVLIAILISFTLKGQNLFDSIIVKQTTNLLPNDRATFSLKYCDNILTQKPQLTFQLLNELKAYLKEHSTINKWEQYYFTLGKYYFFTEKNDSALYYFNKVQANTQNTNTSTKIEINLLLSNIYAFDNIKASYDYLNQAKPLIQKINNNGYLARYYEKQAIIFSIEEKYESASEKFQKSLEIFEAINDSISIAGIYSHIGSMYSQTGNYLMAIDSYEKAENLYRNSNNKYLLAKNLLITGQNFIYASDYNNALNRLVGAESIYKNLNYNEKLIKVYTLKAQTYTYLHKFSQANIQLKQAFTLAKNNHSVQDEILLTWGDLFFAQNNYRKAYQYYYKSLDCTENAVLKVKLYEQLAKVCSKMNNYKMAFKYQVLFNALQNKIISDENTLKTERLKHEIEYQQLSNHKERSLLQKELSILLNSKIERKALYKVTIALLLLILCSVLFILFKKHRAFKQNQHKLHKSISSLKQELSKSKIDFCDLSKTSDRIINLTTQNMWDPFWVLDNLSNQAVNADKFHKKNEYADNEFNRDQLIMARNLIENVLFWSMLQQKKISYNPQNYNADKIILPIIQMQNTRAQAKKITIQQKLISKIKINADKQTIQVAIRNLIENAIKFSTINGQIGVELSQIGKNVEIKIHDDGVGMTKEQINTLFSKHKAYKASGTHGEKGTGLGLILAKEFIERNHGIFTIESSIAYGTTVKIQLPLASA